MKQQGAVEALLRPPIELYASLAALLCALIAFSAPWVFMMPPHIGYMAGTMALGFALWRARWLVRAALPAWPDPLQDHPHRAA